MTLRVNLRDAQAAYNGYVSYNKTILGKNSKSLKFNIDSEIHALARKTEFFKEFGKMQKILAKGNKKMPAQVQMFYDVYSFFPVQTATEEIMKREHASMNGRSIGQLQVMNAFVLEKFGVKTLLSGLRGHLAKAVDSCIAPPKEVMAKLWEAVNLALEGRKLQEVKNWKFAHNVGYISMTYDVLDMGNDGAKARLLEKFCWQYGVKNGAGVEQPSALQM